MKVLLIFMFLNANHEPIGAQLFPGFFKNVETCDAIGDKVVTEEKLPDGVASVKYRCLLTSSSADEKQETTKL